MKRILAAALLASFLALPAAAIDVQFSDTSGTDTVDLIDDGGDSIVLRVDESDLADAYGDPAFVEAKLTCTCGPTQEFFLTDRGNFWSKELPVFTPDLVKGSWTVTIHAEDAAGNALANHLGARTLKILADDQTAPAVAGLQNGALVILGPGQVIEDVLVSDPLLWKATMEADWMDEPQTLSFPYTMSVAQFRTGHQDVEFKAYDRAGNVATRDFEVFADAIPPSVVLDAESLYRGVPNPIQLNVTDHSGFEVVLSLGNETWSQEATGDGSMQTVSIPIVPTQLGEQLLNVSIRDELGNEVHLAQAVEVLEATTDGVLVSGMQVNRPIAGELLRLNVTARQEEAVAGIPFEVFLGQRLLGVIDVPLSDEVTQTFEFLAPPGVRNDELRIVAPDLVQELNGTDNTRSVATEVYVARVTHGEDVYHIRGNDAGIPTLAVDADGETYPLGLRFIEGRSVYAFESDGQDLYWDPAQNVTDVPVADPPVDDKGIPAVALPLLVIAVAIAARRR